MVSLFPNVGSGIARAEQQCHAQIIDVPAVTETNPPFDAALFQETQLAIQRNSRFILATYQELDFLCLRVGPRPGNQ